MPNRIVHAELINRSTIPSEAEVFLVVLPEWPDAPLEIRARLMGPICHHASTVEVAYHFRPVLVPTSRPALTFRAIIPEASPWSPETPHLYIGSVELWHDGQRVDSRPLWIGLHDYRIGPRGLRCNGHLTTLRGTRVTTLDEQTALQLRADHINLLVCPVSPHTRPMWELADRIGFAVLGEVPPDLDPDTLRDLATHPSCLGWLVSSEGDALDTPPPGTIVGTPADHPAASRAHFVVVEPDQPVPAGKPVLLTAGGTSTAPLLGVLVH